MSTINQLLLSKGAAGVVGALKDSVNVTNLALKDVSRCNYKLYSAYNLEHVMCHRGATVERVASTNSHSAIFFNFLGV